MITDAIVTTDSPEGKSLPLRWELQSRIETQGCADNVTLDAVVFDAIPKDEDYDYVVTIDPTSPTLTVNTLDKTIQYIIDNNLDSLISAINSPRLSWIEQNGKKDTRL